MQNGIEFKYINITENISNLKKFLKLRDNNEAFDKIKEFESVGVPCLIVDDENIFFHVNEILVNKLKNN